MVNRIDICNRALTNIGCEPIESEEAQGSETVLLAYDAVLDLLLSIYPWSFNRFLRQLSPKEVPPRAHWKYRFAVPSDRVGPLTAIYACKDDVARDMPIKLFEYRGDNDLLADEPVLWVKYPGRPNPAAGPVIFPIVCSLLSKRKSPCRSARTRGCMIVVNRSCMERRHKACMVALWGMPRARTRNQLPVKALRRKLVIS